MPSSGRGTRDWWVILGMTVTAISAAVSSFSGYAPRQRQPAGPRRCHRLRKQLTARLDELSVQEDRFLDLVGDPEWTQSKIKQRLAKIDHERSDILNKLADTTGKIDIGQRFFLSALDLLRGPRRFYTDAGTSLRRALNKVIFERLYIDVEGVSSHVLQDGRSALVEAGQPASRRYLRPAPLSGGPAWATNETSPTLVGEAGDGWTEAGRLALILSDQGSNRTALVGDTGIEPVTSTVSR